MPKKRPCVFNIVILIQILLIAFGLIQFFYPYLFVSTYSVTKSSLAGDPPANITTILFKLESKGLLTSNFPIDIKIKFYVGSDWEKEFQNANSIIVWIRGSYNYPIKESNGGFISDGSVRISSLTREGTGTIIFPYEGEYSTYAIEFNERLFYIANFPEPNEPTLFKVLDYSTRTSIENNNKNLGIAIISISLTVIGLTYNFKKVRV